MGVLGLTGILTRYAPNSVRQVSANTLAGKTIAFDASCHLNKFMYGEEQVAHKHIYGFYQLARFCQLNQITPIFVFDGAHRLEAKHLEYKKRARARNKTNHSLRLEKDQALRLDVWSGVTDMTSEELADKIKELQAALADTENTDRYTKTVRSLVMREDLLVSDLFNSKLTKPLLKELKRDTRQMVHSLEKRSLRITQKMRTECQDFLKALGFVCFTCENHEAEAMCANLSKVGRTSATVSEDLDTLVFGDAPILRYFFSKGRPILSIDPTIARRDLGLSRESFIDLCILCGTDFSGTIRGIGPHRALQWIQKYGTIENVLQNLASSPYLPQPTFDYELARHVFNNLPPIPIEESEYIGIKQPQSYIDDLLAFYEIDPIDSEVKLKTSLLIQNINTNQQQWQLDPFKNNDFINNKLL
ncbi:PIN domain-like protein [Helicostylum pulchrum]|nr:PIN domain-like protein [Helicostylum pulchrum]